MVFGYQFEDNKLWVACEPSCVWRSFLRRTHVRIYNVPAIFPRRDLKTSEIVWPVDISDLLVKGTSEENHRSDTVREVAQYFSSSKSSIEASDKTVLLAEEPQESLDLRIPTVSEEVDKKRCDVLRRLKGYMNV